MINPVKFINDIIILMTKRIRKIKLSKKQFALVFRKDKLPTEGDTITVGKMVAEFKNKI